MDQSTDSNPDFDFLIKLLTLGDSNVGKTSLLYRYTDNGFNRKFITTVGVDFRQKRIIYPKENDDQESILSQSNSLQIQLWDTAGQERFKSLTVAFFRDAMGFILVFDLTNEQSFLHVQDWLELLQSNAYCERPDTILVGNKVDLVKADGEDDANGTPRKKRAIPYEKALGLANELGIPYIEASAKTGYNVDLIINTLVAKVMRRIDKANLDRETLMKNKDSIFPFDDFPIKRNLGNSKNFNVLNASRSFSFSSGPMTPSDKRCNC